MKDLGICCHPPARLPTAAETSVGAPVVSQPAPTTAGAARVARIAARRSARRSRAAKIIKQAARRDLARVVKLMCGGVMTGNHIHERGISGRKMRTLLRNAINAYDGSFDIYNSDDEFHLAPSDEE
jgi:hypothetical protein